MLSVGCVLLGVRLGMLFDQIAAGSVIGVGVAFIFSAVMDRLKPLLRRHDRA